MQVILGKGRYEILPLHLEPDVELAGIAKRIRARVTIPTGGKLYEYHHVHLADAVAKTLTTVAQIQGRAVLSCSFGKDSLVLAHILTTARFPLYAILYSDRGLYAELPETELLIEACIQRFGWEITRLYPARNMFQLYTDIGGIPGITVKGDHRIIKRTNLVAPMQAYAAQHEISCNIMGRRAEENPRTRGRHIAVRGMLSYNQEFRFYTCDPLGHWTARQVWGYIHQHDLPYHPAYDHEYREGRERARLSNWCGIVAKERGRFALLRRDYPELFNYFYARFPEVGQFT